MPIWNPFSRRKRWAKQGGPEPDVYSYDNIPVGLKTQIVYLWQGAIGPFEPASDSFGYRGPNNAPAWQEIHSVLAREHGLFSLGSSAADPFRNCQEFLFSKRPIPDILDIIELTFQVIYGYIGLEQWQMDEWGIREPAADAIQELNFRFREAAVGYRFEGGELIEVKSQLIHQEAVKPALRLLSAKGFEGPNGEFLKAHEHYRAGDYETAIVEALKSFESTLKVVCAQRQWAVSEKATALPLIKTVLDNELLPKYLDSSLTALPALLIGLATIRNREAGHGAGVQVREVPEYLASYALHLAATNIVFIVGAHTA